MLDCPSQQTFRRCVERYGGNQHVKRFTCHDQYRRMAFTQLTYGERLRDIVQFNSWDAKTQSGHTRRPL